MLLFVLGLTIGLPGQAAHSQSVSFLSQRAFVTSFTPVIGRNGAVGGVDIDADGVLKRVRVQPTEQLAVLRANATHGASLDVRRASPMRKVSLRRMEAEIAKSALEQKALTEEILFLAGLQRIEYVFAYPSSGDIVIAGPAEGWVFKNETMIGATSGDAVMRLDDLLDALQGNTAGVAGEAGMSCSIDPTQAGLARVQQMQQMIKNRKLPLNEDALETMERQMGDQIVTVTGVRPTSHFARVMVVADYLMKRIAMGLDPSPIAHLPSYMQMLKRGTASTQWMAPRWWMATDYESVEKSEDGLAWQIQGRGVQVLSEHGYLNARGELIDIGRPSPIAQLWADTFTKRYDDLAKQLSVFGQLRCCVDLAVVAALLKQEGLLDRANCSLPLLTDPSKLVGEEFSIPKHVPSQSSVLRSRRGWIVSVSGGVDLDTWKVLEHIEINPKLAVVHEDSLAESQHWWWD